MHGLPLLASHCVLLYFLWSALSPPPPSRIHICDVYVKQKVHWRTLCELLNRTCEPLAYLADVELWVRPYVALQGTFMLLCVFTVSNKTRLACIISKHAVAVCRLECVYGRKSLWRKSSRTAALRDAVLHKGWYSSYAKKHSPVFTRCVAYFKVVHVRLCVCMRACLCMCAHVAWGLKGPWCT